MFTDKNIIVLDLEVQNDPRTVQDGWGNKARLGLAIGAYYSYLTNTVSWFDMGNLYDTIAGLVALKPLMVSFNGISFDFALMRAVIRHQGESDTDSEETLQAFKALASDSYDILAEIWRADAANKFVRGLNSLDAILLANNLGQKSGSGEQAPRWWQQGQHARVLNYCSDDVYLTKALFEHIAQHQGRLQRSTGPLDIRYVTEDLQIIDPPERVDA